MKKRLEEEVSWPLSEISTRINSSQGNALGAYHYMLTLFAKSGETISTAFKHKPDCDEFEQMVIGSLGPLLE